MTTVIILMAIAILLGLGGTIILVLGLINKKNVTIISGGIMLLFTILFCTGAVFCSARPPMDKGHEPFGYMMPPIGMPMQPVMDMQNHKVGEPKPMIDAPQRRPNDSTCNKTVMKH
jgi:hypothetical protein